MELPVTLKSSWKIPQYSFIILLMSAGSVAIFPDSFSTSVFCKFSLFFSVSLAGSLSILLIFLKVQLSLIFSTFSVFNFIDFCFYLNYLLHSVCFAVNLLFFL